MPQLSKQIQSLRSCSMPDWVTYKHQWSKGPKHLSYKSGKEFNSSCIIVGSLHHKKGLYVPQCPNWASKPGLTGNKQLQHLWLRGDKNCTAGVCNSTLTLSSRLVQLAMHQWLLHASHKSISIAPLSVSGWILNLLRFWVNRFWVVQASVQGCTFDVASLG
jgi:hypothetical protein